MRKIILFTIAFCMVFLTSCNCGKKNHIIISDEDNEWTTYLNQFYEEINTEGRKYVAVDLRSKELYETEHLRQFQNYDLNSGSIDELNTWLCSNYSNKYIIYIYIESLENLKTFNILLEKFKHIEVYIGDYNTLRNKGEELFTFDFGPYDCNC